MVTQSFLMHHGVLGQKWGVRRYQNKDGTRTDLGKRVRSFDGKFAQATLDVKSKASNKYSPFERSPINVDEIQNRSGLRKKDANKCAALALVKFNEASEIEPKITDTIISSASNNGSKMYGLEHRLKQPTSMAGKIGSDAKEKGISFEKASESIKDSIRYTVLSDDNNFSKAYLNIKTDLEKSGYTEIRCRNYFDEYRKGNSSHKSVQCVYSDKDGNMFEVQFQTPSSQAAKELKLPLYEERRTANVSKERAQQLEKEMKKLAEKVKDPTGVYRIKSYG